MADAQHIAELEAYYRSKGAKNPKSLALINGDRPLAACLGDPSPILAKLMAGQTKNEIADELGVHRDTLNAWLLANCPDEWKAIHAGKSLSRIEAAEEALDDPDADKNKINRAAQSGRLAARALERAARSIYGEPEKNGPGITVNVNVDRSCDGQITIEHGQD